MQTKPCLVINVAVSLTVAEPRGAVKEGYHTVHIEHRLPDNELVLGPNWTHNGNHAVNCTQLLDFSHGIGQLVVDATTFGIVLMIKR